MAQGHVLSSCFAFIPFSDHLPSLFLVFSISSLAFLWYSSSKKRNYSTPHSNTKGPDAAHDMYSVLKKPTTTSTTAYITPSTVPRPDATPIDENAWLCQPYDAFLVLDVEATCLQGAGFHWPNEIIVRYRTETRSHRSVEYRSGLFVSLSGRTGGTMAWSVPCTKSQSFAAS
jgi:hypothetical protein